MVDLIPTTENEVQTKFPHRSPAHDEAWMDNVWRKQLLHLLKQPKVLDAAADALDAQNDDHWAAMLVLYSVTCIDQGLIAESTAAVAAYEATWGAAEAQHQAAYAAWCAANGKA